MGDFQPIGAIVSKLLRIFSNGPKSEHLGRRKRESEDLGDDMEGLGRGRRGAIVKNGVQILKALGALLTYYKTERNCGVPRLYSRVVIKPLVTYDTLYKYDYVV